MSSSNENPKIAALQSEIDQIIPVLLKETDSVKKKEMALLVDKKRREIAKVKSGKLINKDMRRTLVAYSFIAPNFIGFAVFTLIPVVFAFVLAFMEWDGSNPMKFVGVSNFVRLFDDTFFLAALKNTLIYCIGTVPLTMAASLGLAILLNQKVIGKGIFRTVAFFPYVASLVAVASVWKMLFSKTGPVNAILYYVFQVPSKSLPQWFTGALVLVSYILFSVWKYMGYYMVIYLAGLQGISAELYEAASLDGATGWQRFRYVTLPQLRPTTFFVTIMLTINCFKVFDVATLLAGGDNNVLTVSSTVLVHYIYQKAFAEWNFGYSSAIAMVLFLLVLIVTIIQFRGEAKQNA